MSFLVLKWVGYVYSQRGSDRNGPWLAESLRQLGVDVGQIVVVGDRPEDMRGRGFRYISVGRRGPRTQLRTG